MNLTEDEPIPVEILEKIVPQWWREEPFKYDSFFVNIPVLPDVGKVVIVGAQVKVEICTQLRVEVVISKTTSKVVIVGTQVVEIFTRL